MTFHSDQIWLRGCTSLGGWGSEEGDKRPVSVGVGFFDCLVSPHSADQALDRFAMKRFYEDKIVPIGQPSQRRWVPGTSPICAFLWWILCLVHSQGVDSYLIEGVSSMGI